MLTMSPLRALELPDNVAVIPFEQLALPLKLLLLVGGHGGAGTGDPKLHVTVTPPPVIVAAVMKGPSDRNTYVSVWGDLLVS